MTVKAPHKWILSATPMINRASDYLGYLSMFFEEAWGQEVSKYALVESYFPESWATIPESYSFWLHDIPLSVLDPKTFARLVNRDLLEGHVAQTVLHSIYRVLQLRRTKATKIEVLGETTRIGDSIPPYEICTVELRMNAYQASVYNPIYESYIHELSQKDDRQSPKGKQGSSKSAATIHAKGRRHQGVHRRLCLATLDPNLETFCNRTYDRNLASHIHEYSSQFEDDGLTVYFSMVSPEPGMPHYTHRQSLAAYLCMKSPKFQYLCGYLYRNLFPPPDATEQWEKRRLLIFVMWPASHWIVVAFLRNLCFKVVMLRSDMSETEKTQAMHLFNDPDSDVDVMVASCASAGLGVNLQRACADILFIEVSLLTTVKRSPLPLPFSNAMLTRT